MKCKPEWECNIVTHPKQKKHFNDNSFMTLHSENDS